MGAARKQKAVPIAPAKEGLVEVACARTMVGITAAELQQREFPPVKWIVPGFITEGCTMLAGRPKTGKSWLALNIATAIACGGPVLGAECQQGDVLGLFLEDNDRRMQDRMRQLLQTTTNWPSRFEVVTQSASAPWPRVGEGKDDCIEWLERWATSKENPRAVIVDVLEKVRPVRDRGKGAYQEDYEAIHKLQEFANRWRLACVIVHHTRKAKSDGDPVDEISGSLGGPAAADAFFILKRGEGGAHFLTGRGRDLPDDIDKAIKFDRTRGLWTLAGEAEAFRGSAKDREIIELLEDAGEALTVADIAKAVGGKANVVRVRLTRMAAKNQVEKSGRGCYKTSNRM